jgi:hypothetical protein
MNTHRLVYNSPNWALVRFWAWRKAATTRLQPRLLITIRPSTKSAGVLEDSKQRNSPLR